jgi:hypothetical protein
VLVATTHSQILMLSANSALKVSPAQVHTSLQLYAQQVITLMLEQPHVHFARLEMNVLLLMGL